MEKLSQMKKNFFKFLPKQPVASAAFHQNLTLSPPRSPVSIIPKGSRRRKHKGGGMSFSTAKEPASPKVSCMGQVRCKNKKMAQKHKSVKQLEMKNESDSSAVSCAEKKERILVWISKLGRGGEGPKQSGEAFVVEEKASSAPVEAPSLGNMKKFASGRVTSCDVDFALAKW